MTDTNREALFLEALRQIAAPASVPLDQLPAHDQPNGWRDIAVERIDIARATEQMRKEFAARKEAWEAERNG